MRHAIIPLYSRVELFLEKRPSVVACQAGCDACCHLPVDATAVELLALVQHVLATQSQEAVERIRAASQAYLEHVRGLTDQARLKVRRPCPMLVDKQCTAYEVRPLPCRGFHSGSKAQCDQVIPAGSSTLFEFPDFPRLQAVQAAGEVLRTSVVAMERDAGAYDLACALAPLLDDPQAAQERWECGQPLLDDPATRAIPLEAAAPQQPGAKKVERQPPLVTATAYTGCGEAIQPVMKTQKLKRKQ